MLTCSKCLRLKEDSDFPWRVKGLKRQRICKECQREVSAAWYSNNKERQIATVVANNERYRKQLVAVCRKAKDCACADCGIHYPHWILEFDHLPGTKKLFTIGAKIRHNISVETLLNEIAKCEVVCANCHRDRTYKRRHGII